MSCLNSSFLVCALLFIGVTIPSSGQHISVSSIDSLLQSASPRPFNGVMLIREKGKRLYLKSNGYADIEHKTPLETKSQFIIGSISKQITAVLVLRELDKGNLSLQDPIKKYLPHLTQNWADSVTIHHLLNHTSGITALDKPSAFKPGTQFSYSGLVGFQLLGNIIERTSGKSYASLAADLFRMCHMKHTTVPASYKNGKLVKCYMESAKWKFQPEIYNLKEIEPFTPAGGIISTAEDLALWNECLHGGKLLKKSSYQLMTTASATRPHARWGNIGYGYGLQIDTQRESVEFSHNGALVAFIGTNIYYPATQTSFVVLENVTCDFEGLDCAFYYHDQVRDMLKLRK